MYSVSLSVTYDHFVEMCIQHVNDYFKLLYPFVQQSSSEVFLTALTDTKQFIKQFSGKRTDTINLRPLENCLMTDITEKMNTALEHKYLKRR